MPGAESVTAIPPSPPRAPRRSRHEASWDQYSNLWDRYEEFRAYRWLGDEWGPEELVRHIVDTYAAPYLRPESRVLEIGPGGGRYTRYLIERCASLTAIDVSSRMLERSRRRFAEVEHARFVKGNGHDLAPIADASVDFAFSCNVFVQLDLEDVFGYLAELRRVLAPGGVASIHYADFSGPEGWMHFLQSRERWADDPLQRGRFCELTLSTMEMLAARAGLSVLRNQYVARDAILVAVRPAVEGAAPESARPSFGPIQPHLDDLAGDVYHEMPTPHHTAAARDAIDRLVAGRGIESVLELGCGAAPCLDRAAELGMRTLGVSLGAEPCAHRVVRADFHASGLPSNEFDVVIARHVLEHSAMPLVALLEMRRLTRRYALVVVPCDEPIWIDWPNHYSVLSRLLWKKLFARARFRVVAEEDGPLEPSSTEWRFLLERDDVKPS
ncbi:MAG TPA: methyltransferase domain-containing protein [Planctomycetota bacterium]|nr:methyltransferase domain-containing protein [Planctomycetota bacterium]